MEILKFDESGTSSPSRKRSGRGAILITFVALVFGAGTALASGTLSINSGNGIALDQGVAATVQCDNDGVNISLDSSINDIATKFYLTGISVTNISDNCIGKSFRLKVYDSTGNLQTFCDPGFPDIDCYSTYVQKIVSDDLTSTDNNPINFTFSKVLEIVDASTASHVTIESIG